MGAALYCLPCSTPFGIRGLSPFSLRSCMRMLSVLNAFRHQRFIAVRCTNKAHIIIWCSTPFGIRGLSPLMVTSIKARSPRCSTPFGIRGLSPLRMMESSTRLFVLNAFRHQRFIASISEADAIILNVMCSTPFGIRGLSPIAAHHCD